MFLRFVFARTRMTRRLDTLHTKFKIQKMNTSTSSSSRTRSTQDSTGDSKEGEGDVNPDTLFPASHTCFFSIQLPEYRSKQVLHDRLLYAVHNCTTMDADVKLKDNELYNVDADDLHI